MNLALRTIVKKKKEICKAIATNIQTQKPSCFLEIPYLILKCSFYVVAGWYKEKHTNRLPKMIFLKEPMTTLSKRKVKDLKLENLMTAVMV